MRIKYVFLIIFLFLTNELSFSQDNYYLTFVNCTKDSFGAIHNGINKGKLKIFDSNNNALSFKENNLPGEYVFKTDDSKIKVEFENIFKQTIDTIISLSSNEEQYFICEETFLDDNKLTSVEKCISSNKAWVLNFFSTGCFHMDKEQIKIYYVNNVPYLEFSVNDIVKREIILTKKRIQKLILFEKQLLNMNNEDYSCTTTDVYKMKSKFNKLEIIDNSCLWDGFNLLKKELKLDKK